MLLNTEMAETKEVSLTSGLTWAVVLGVLLSDRPLTPPCLPPPSPGCSFWGGELTPELCCVKIVLLRTTLLAETTCLANKTRAQQAVRTDSIH